MPSDRSDALCNPSSYHVRYHVRYHPTRPMPSASIRHTTSVTTSDTIRHVRCRLQAFVIPRPLPRPIASDTSDAVCKHSSYHVRYHLTCPPTPPSPHHT